MREKLGLFVGAADRTRLAAMAADRNGADRLAEIVRGVRFRDGETVTAAED
jgi:hypothetical protein